MHVLRTYFCAEVSYGGAGCWVAGAVEIPSSDPLYRAKRDKLAAHKLSTQQTFQLQRNQVSPFVEDSPRTDLTCAFGPVLCS